MFRFAQHDNQSVGRFNASTVYASTIKNNVLRRRIQHGATADGFAKCFTEMTETGVANFRCGFSDVVASRAQELGRAFHAQVAQILRNSQTDLTRKNPAKIKRAAAHFLRSFPAQEG